MVSLGPLLSFAYPSLSSVLCHSCSLLYGSEHGLTLFSMFDFPRLLWVSFLSEWRLPICFFWDVQRSSCPSVDDPHFQYCFLAPLFVVCLVSPSSCHCRPLWGVGCCQSPIWGLVTLTLTAFPSSHIALGMTPLFPFSLPSGSVIFQDSSLVPLYSGELLFRSGRSARIP